MVCTTPFHNEEQGEETQDNQVVDFGVHAATLRLVRTAQPYPSARNAPRMIEQGVFVEGLGARDFSRLAGAGGNQGLWIITPGL